MAGILTAACDAGVSGGASPVSTPPAASTNPSTSSANPFDGVNPCTILDQTLNGEGFPAATPTVADAQHSCRSQNVIPGNPTAVDVALSLQAGQRYDENVDNPTQAKPGHVQKRAAIEVPTPLGSDGQCEVHIEVKPSSRALLIIGSGSDTANACKLAEKYADKVGPLLPNG
jgi:hypothetical protein